MSSVIINGTLLSFISQKKGLWKWLLYILAVTVAVLSIMAIYQYITGHSNLAGRAHAAFVNPNSFSGYLLLTSPILIGLYLICKSLAGRVFFLLLITISFAALLASGTGGRWIAIVAAIVVALALFWMFLPAQRKKLLFLFVGLIAVVLIFIIPAGEMGEGIFLPNIKEISGSTSDRLNIWKSTWGIIKEHPIRGVGFWSFHTIYSKYKNEIYRNVTHPFSHNDYLQLWAELGIVGVGVFLVLVYLYFRGGLRSLKIDTISKTNRIMLLSTMIGSFLLLVHTISDFDLYVPSILFVFWIYIAYATATARELSLCKTKIIDLRSFRIFTVLGKKKLYIITGALFAFASFWIIDPYLAGLYNDKGKTHLIAGEYEKAVTFFGKATDLDPIDDSYHFNLGLALAKSSSDPMTLGKAEDEMKRAIAISPYRSDLYFELANFYREFFLKEKGDVAVEMLKKARELDPLNMIITHNMGVIYLQLGVYEDAIGEFKRYLKVRPNDISARIELSEAYRMNKEYDNAIREIEWIIEKNDDNNFAHFLKARLFKDKQDFGEAYKEYKLALREKGREGELWYEIGKLFLMQGNIKKAEEAFREALEYKKDNMKTLN
jgi:O-antigen ligase/tetratricopeptide (TPR) repeat protein